MRPICLLALVFALPLQAGLEWKTTRIVVNAGIDDKQTTAIFPFTNTGEEPVTIRDISTTCGCTTAALDKRVYLPGEAGAITAVFDHGDRAGRNSKTIRVVATGGETKTHDLELTVDIPTLLRVSPMLLRWRVGEAPAPKVLRVETDPNYPISIKETVIGPEHGRGAGAASVFAVSEPVQVGEGVYEITVTPVDTAQPTNRGGQIKTDFPADSPRFANFWIRIF